MRETLGCPITPERSIRLARPREESISLKFHVTLSRAMFGPECARLLTTTELDSSLMESASFNE